MKLTIAPLKFFVTSKEKLDRNVYFILVTYGIENRTQYQYQTYQRNTRNMMTIMTPICHSYQRLATPRPQSPGKTEWYIEYKRFIQ